ncbi:MAG: GtrA family protein, partial [Candidatus Uhrbacteria bacterium]|nr:GtrA family protein [Candidatus Uhrbacteria bacterium]
TILSYYSSVSLSFVLNSRYTFTSDNKDWKHTYIKYFAVNIIGSVLDVIITYGSYQIFFSNLDNGKIYAKIISVSILAIINFFFHKGWTFQENGND